MSLLSPHDLITSRRWEHALFTTYSLSLSFFEAHLLRTGLKLNGCGDIWVVADADGYSDSLAEKQATSVGQDYHLVPVALPHGVFHPKCTYLAGPDGDILIVGSGNLTFGGYGRNVEAFEAFGSTEHPAIFTEFAEFLDELRGRRDFLNPEPAWIDVFTRLARRAGRNVRSRGAPEACLVHCVQTPVSESLKAVISENGGASSMRVLSPFFDPDGSAMARIAEENNLGKVVVGLLPEQASRSAFPFTRHTLGKRLRAATIEDPVESLDRRLHAKWIEVDMRDERVLTLTGSVNATTQSLCTTNNIEVGVLRMEPVATARRLRWRACALPAAYEAQTFRAAGLGSRCVLHARLAEGTTIEGHLLASGDPAGHWEARLARKDGVSTTFSVAIDHKGEFSHRLSSPSDFEHSAGLQLDLSRQLPSPMTACGWVQNEAVLALSQLSQVPVHSLLNQIRGEVTDEDDVLVLELLATGLQDLWVKSAGNSVRGDAAPKPAEPSMSVPVSALEPGEPLHPDTLMSRGPSSFQRLMGILDRVVSRVFEGRTGAGVHMRALPRADGDESVSGGVVAGSAEIPSRAVVLLDHIRDKVREIPDSEQRRVLLNLWLGVSLQLILRSDHRAEAGAFCREWFFAATQSHTGESATGRLTQNVFHVATVLAANVAGDADAARELVRLHDALENFLGANVPSNVIGHLSPLPPLLARVLKEGAATTAAALDSVLNSRTRRQEIELVVRAIKARQPPPAKDLAIFSSSTGRQLLRDMQGSSWPRLIEFNPSRSSCPHPQCYFRLPDESLRELKRLRLCRCVHCNSYIYQLAISE
jgi:hypothetical protein